MPARSPPSSPSTTPSTIHHFGGITVTPGFTDPAKFTDGNPYGTSHVDAQGNNPVDDTTRTAARIQAERAIKIAAVLKAAA
jgi:NAD(P)H dehydrogenase (quinone)